MNEQSKDGNAFEVKKKSKDLEIGGENSGCEI